MDGGLGLLTSYSGHSLRIQHNLEQKEVTILGNSVLAGIRGEDVAPWGEPPEGHAPPHMSPTCGHAPTHMTGPFHQKSYANQALCDSVSPSVKGGQQRYLSCSGSYVNYPGSG